MKETAIEFYRTMWNPLHEGTNHKQFSYNEMIEFANDYHQAKLKSMVPSSEVSELLPLVLKDEIKLGQQMKEWKNRVGEITATNQLSAMLRQVGLCVAKKPNN